MSHSPRACPAFSLIELLVVMAFIALLAGLVVPVMSVVGDGRSVGRSVYQIADLLQQARAQAMARNTYVLVGVGVQSGNDTADQFVAVATRMSTDGLRPGSWATGTNVLDLGKVYRYDRLTLASVTDDFGGKKPAADAQLAAASGTTLFQRAVGGVTYQFTRALEFSPTGEMRLAGQQDFQRVTEIGLISANRRDASHSAALQVSGLTGAVRVFQP